MTYLVRHEENLRDDDDSGDVVRRLRDHRECEHPLNNWEERRHEVIEGLAVFEDLEFVGLEDGLQSAQATDDGLLVVRPEPLFNLCSQAAPVPHIVFALGDVVDDVLDA